MCKPDMVYVQISLALWERERVRVKRADYE
jgi:hypothetical protein